jgi:hypothetical protein
MTMSPTEFADVIEFYRDDIVNAWMDAVRADPRIHSDDRLHEYALRDHVPAIIEEICQLLREGETPKASNTREARVHTYLRYRQGYASCHNSGWLSLTPLPTAWRMRELV